MYSNKKGPLNYRFRFKLIFIVSTIAIISMLDSCKGKGEKAVISSADSLLITQKLLIDKIDKMYTLKFSREQQRAIFINNDVKQVQFRWRDYGNSTWGLTAYGVNANGVQVPGAGPIDLERMMFEPLTTNYQGLKRPGLQIIVRGDLKALLNLSTRGQDVPIESGQYQDLLFTPTQVSYPESDNMMFYYITMFPNIVLLGPDAPLTGQQANTNPSPPANSICGTGCDDSSF